MMQDGRSRNSSSISWMSGMNLKDLLATFMPHAQSKTARQSVWMMKLSC